MFTKGGILTDPLFYVNYRHTNVDFIFSLTLDNLLILNTLIYFNVEMLKKVPNFYK